MSPRNLSLVEWHMVAALLHTAQWSLRLAADLFANSRTTLTPSAGSEDSPAETLRNLAARIGALCTCDFDRAFASEHPREHCLRLVEARPCYHPEHCGLPMEPLGALSSGYVSERDRRIKVAKLYSEAMKCCKICGEFASDARVIVTEFSPALERELGFAAPMVPTLGRLVDEIVGAVWAGFSTTLQFKIVSHGHVVRAVGYICLLRTEQQRPWAVASHNPPWPYKYSCVIPSGLLAISVDENGNVQLVQVDEFRPHFATAVGTLFVDREHGDDSNQGTRHHPIKTFGEWNRRQLEAHRERGNTP